MKSFYLPPRKLRFLRFLLRQRAQLQNRTTMEPSPSSKRSPKKWCRPCRHPSPTIPNIWAMIRKTPCTFRPRHSNLHRQQRTMARMSMNFGCVWTKTGCTQRAPGIRSRSILLPRQLPTILTPAFTQTKHPITMAHRKQPVPVDHPHMAMGASSRSSCHRTVLRPAARSTLLITGAARPPEERPART